MMLRLVIAIATLASAASAQSQHRSYGPPVAPIYQMSDSSGQAWQHTDAARLSSWVARRNAGMAPQIPATPPADTARGVPVPLAAPNYGDPYGFTAWLNGYRAANGRGPIGYDPDLSAWASANNGQQHARGMGHHVMGSARRQNSGMGDGGTVWRMWTASPAHQAALLDPTITRIGISAAGSYWTFNAY